MQPALRQSLYLCNLLFFFVFGNTPLGQRRNFMYVRYYVTFAGDKYLGHAVKFKLRGRLL